MKLAILLVLVLLTFGCTLMTKPLTKEEAITIVTTYDKENDLGFGTKGMTIEQLTYKFENNTLFIDAFLTQMAFVIDPDTRTVIDTYKLGD